MRALIYVGDIPGVTKLLTIAEAGGGNADMRPDCCGSYQNKNGATAHGFNNLSDKTASALCTLPQASIVPAYFREIAGVISADGQPDMRKDSGYYEKTRP